MNNFKKPEEILREIIKDEYKKFHFTKEEEKFIVRCMLEYSAIIVDYVTSEDK